MDEKNVPKYSQKEFFYLVLAAISKVGEGDLPDKPLSLSEDTFLQIGMVVGLVLHLEAKICAMIAERYPSMPNKFVEDQPWHAKLSMLRTFAPKELVRVLKLAAKIRNNIVHCLYGDREINNADLTELQRMATKNFNYQPSEKFLKHATVFQLFSTICAHIGMHIHRQQHMLGFACHILRLTDEATAEKDVAVKTEKLAYLKSASTDILDDCRILFPKLFVNWPN